MKEFLAYCKATKQRRCSFCQKRSSSNLYCIVFDSLSAMDFHICAVCLREMLAEATSHHKRKDAKNATTNRKV